MSYEVNDEGSTLVFLEGKGYNDGDNTFAVGESPTCFYKVWTADPIIKVFTEPEDGCALIWIGSTIPS